MTIAVFNNAVVRKILLGVTFIAILLLLYLNFFELAIVAAWSIQASDSALFPVVIIIILFLFFVLLLSASLATAILGYALEARSADNKMGVTTAGLKEKRKAVIDTISHDSLERLDEYWEIAIFVIAASVFVFSAFGTSFQMAADWTQVVISLVFWILYKLGKARQSIDLRLLAISSAVQFVFLIVGIYVMIGLVDFILIQWTEVGHPMSAIYPWPSPEWIILFFLIISVGFLLAYLSKDVGIWFSRRVWSELPLSEEAAARGLEEEPLYLVEGGMPSFLFYGSIWLIVLLLPLMGEGVATAFFSGFFEATLIALMVLGLGWWVKIRFAQYELTGRRHGRGIQILLKAYSIAHSVLAHVSGVFVLVLIVFFLPYIAFGMATASPQQAILVTRMFSAALVLFLATCLDSI